MGDVVQLPVSSMPYHLASQVWRLSQPPDPAYAGLPLIKPYPDPAAAEWLRRKREWMAERATREGCHEWFVSLCLGINGVTADAFHRREIAIWEMCQDMPLFVWSIETRRAMWARTSFLPTPGECREVFETYLVPFRREIAALEHIAYAEPEPEPTRSSKRYVPPLPPEWALNGPAHPPAEPGV